MEYETGAVRSVYDRFSSAVVDGDSRALLELHADDFKASNLDGSTYTREQWEAALDRQLHSVSYQDVHCKVDKVTTDGDDIVVYVTKRFAGTRPEGTKFHSTVRSRDTLRSVGSGLRIYATDTFNLDRLEHDLEPFGARAWRGSSEPLRVEELAVTKALEQMNGSPT